MKILAISTSNSSNSINYNVLNNLEDIDLISLINYDVPMYSIDSEVKFGFNENIKKFVTKISEYDVIILGVPEHNGNVPAYFKNIFDWCTRYDYDFLKNKKIILITATPGKRGGSSVRKILADSLPFFKATVIGSYPVANYNEIEDLKAELKPIQDHINKLNLGVTDVS